MSQRDGRLHWLWPTLDDLKNYAARFLRWPEDSATNLEILYECLRHKIAHLAYPYAVFDTHTSMKLRKTPKRRVTWTICASARRPGMRLLNVMPPRDLRKTPVPWTLAYDCRIVVNVKRLQIDIAKSIYGASGYLAHLKSDAGGVLILRNAWTSTFRVKKCQPRPVWTRHAPLTPPVQRPAESGAPDRS